MADVIDLTAPLTVRMPGRLKPDVDHKPVLAALHACIIQSCRSAAVQQAATGPGRLPDGIAITLEVDGVSVACADPASATTERNSYLCYD